MRLICPNCEAQYEVSDDAITPGGRDVQCSNCQTSWFQTAKQTNPTPVAPQPKPMPEVEPEPVPEIAPDPLPEVEPDPVPEVEPEAPVEIPRPATPELPPETPVEEPEESNFSLMEEIIAETESTSAVKMPPADEAEAAPAPPAAPKRKPLDSAVTNILREEAALATADTIADDAPETSVKAEPPAPTPAPPVPRPVASPKATEAAKPRPAVAADETRKHVATMTAQEDVTSAEEAEAHLRTVPSMNEINATLRARAQANDATGLTEAEKAQAVERKGFRRGFFAVALILLALILPYIFAGQITQNMPQTADVMASYVMTVDKLRLSLSELIAGFTAG